MSFIDFIKNLFQKSMNKQLPETTTLFKHSRDFSDLQVTPLSEMTVDEINEVLEKRQKFPKAKTGYGVEQLLKAIFLKMGVEEELARRASENVQVQKIFSFHDNGRLVESEDRKTYFEDRISEEDVTTIQYQEEKIILQSLQDKEYYGEDRQGRAADKDSRPVHKVEISLNDLGGVTLENEETGTFFKMIDHRIHDHYYSTIVYDSNNIEWKKKKEQYNGATTIVERRKEDPLTIIETYLPRKEERKGTEEYISYASINPTFPDKLYAREDIAWTHVGRVDRINKLPILKERIEALKYRNPKAADYFESLRKVPKDKKEKQR